MSDTFHSELSFNLKIKNVRFFWKLSKKVQKVFQKKQGIKIQCGNHVKNFF